MPDHHGCTELMACCQVHNTLVSVQANHSLKATLYVLLLNAWSKLGNGDMEAQQIDIGTVEHSCVLHALGSGGQLQVVSLR